MLSVKAVLNFFLRKRYVILLVIIFSIFLLNTFHEEYPDEYDSMTGGLYITQGKIPYRDWFQHHQPFAYVFAALLLPFAGISLVKFRIALAFAYFFLNIGIFFLLKNRFGEIIKRIYLFLLVTIALSATYFWGHMLLADSLAAYLLLPAYAWLLFLTFQKENTHLKDLLIVSLFTFFSFLTSSTYIYVVAGLNIFALYLYFAQSRFTLNRENTIKSMLIFAFPYIAFLLFLIVTGSLKDYYNANVIYNQYYVYNYPHVYGGPINPIRYAVVIAQNFINNYYSILSGVFAFAVGDPFNMTLAVSNAAFFILILLTNNYAFLFPFLITLIFSNARSNPSTIHQTDYQSSVYILTSFLNGIFSLRLLKNLLDNIRLTFSYKVVASAVFVVLGIYWAFNSVFILEKFSQKFYSKYMGEAPFIYDAPEIAPLVNKITGKNEYVWIGPFEFKELFYLQGKMPSRYHWFLQHAAAISWYKDGMIADFQKNRPMVIVFKNFAPWGGDPKQFNYFFTDFLGREYVRLDQINTGVPGSTYKWNIGDTRNFNLGETFYFDKTRQDEIVNKLFEQSLIKQVSI